MNRVFQERLDELETEVFDKGVLRTEEGTNVPAILTLVPPNLETRPGSVPAVPQVLQSSSERARTEVRCIGSTRRGTSEEDRSSRRKLGPVNQAVETTSGTSR